MGERRKRKSMWDVGEEKTKQFPGISEHNSSHEFSSSRASTGPKPRDHSGKPPRESNEEKRSVSPLNAGFDKARPNSPEGKEIGGGGNRHYQNMSPGFDGNERHNKLESDRSDFRRHPRRDQSRSRSPTRSRSPVRDYRNQSEKSFRICREFSAGRCTRGSQCRFLHSKNIDHSHISKDSNFREDKSFALEEMNGSENPAHPIFGQDVDGFGSGARLEACLDLPSQMTTELNPVTNPAVSPNEKVTRENGNLAQPDNAYSEADEGNNNNKVARLFKNSLIEFVKEILKPTWKEGRLSRDEHKTIVKKVVDKVTSTVQEDHIPKTQEKVDQYLSFSKPKIGKLVQAYVERSVKTDS